MCIALPMTVVAVDGLVARVVRSNINVEVQTVDAIGIDDLHPGDNVLVFRGTVLRKVDPQEAQRIEAALCYVAAVMADDEADPDVIQKAWCDLTNRESA